MLQLKGDTGNGVDALKRHPKIRSVTPQKRVERFLKSVEGTVQQDSFKINLKKLPYRMELFTSLGHKVKVSWCSGMFQSCILMLHKRREVQKGIQKIIISYYSSTFTINPQPWHQSVHSHSIYFVLKIALLTMQPPTIIFHPEASCDSIGSHHPQG